MGREARGEVRDRSRGSPPLLQPCRRYPKRRVVSLNSLLWAGEIWMFLARALRALANATLIFIRIANALSL